MIVGFDLTDIDSFNQVNYWIDQIEANKSKDYPISLILFGNKCDIKENIAVKDTDIESLKNKYNLEFFATSAKDGTNVQNAFEFLIKKILKTRKFLEKIGLSPGISFDDIIIKEKEKENLVKETNPTRKKKQKKNWC